MRTAIPVRKRKRTSHSAGSVTHLAGYMSTTPQVYPAHRALTLRLERRLAVAIQTDALPGLHVTYCHHRQLINP
jgi:hypothetical protein